MRETLKSAWNIPELRKKILYTLFMLLVYRLLCFIPTPGVDATQIATAIENISVLGYMSTITGSNMSQYTIMAMGITPYINASIIMQLLTVAIPKLEELSKQGDEGRKKIAQITRYVTVGLGFVQAIALTASLKASAYAPAGGASYFLSLLTIGFCMAAGTALAMWIGERITENGIGNGISLLIFSGIVARFSSMVLYGIGGIFTGRAVNYGTGIASLIIFLVLVIGIVFVDLGERRIPVQYAKRVVGRKMYGGQNSHIPLKINASGVLPLIFANAMLEFPSTIMTLFGGNNWWTQNFNGEHWAYNLAFAVLIFAFAFFYSSISFNPMEISKNIQNNGGMIPGIRQGRPTADFIRRSVRRITLFGAIFLAVLALIPYVIYTLFNTGLSFAASSLLIAVSVAMETTRQLESQMTMRHYKGFLK